MGDFQMDWNIKPPDSPIEGQMKRAQLRHIGQSDQIQALDIQQQKQSMADDQTWRQAIGVSDGNAETALTSVAGHVSPKSYFAIQQQVARMHQEKQASATSQQQIDQNNNDAFANLAVGAKQSDNPLQAMQSGLQTYAQMNPSHRDQAQQISQHLQQNPNDIDQVITNSINLSPKASERLIEIQKAKDAQNAAADTRLAAANTDATSKAALPGVIAESAQKKVISDQYVDQGKTQQQTDELEQQKLNEADRQRKDAANQQHWLSMLGMQQKRMDMADDRANNRTMTPDAIASQGSARARTDVKLGEDAGVADKARGTIGALLNVPVGKPYVDPRTQQKVDQTPQTLSELRNQFGIVSRHGTDLRNQRADLNGRERPAPYDDGSAQNPQLKNVGQTPPAQAAAPVQQQPAARQPAAQAAPPFPSSLTQADVGKTYRSATGKTLKITKVNPANPKQFQSQAQ